MSYTKYAIIAIIFLSWYNLYSQNDFDSEYPTPLTQKSYEELKHLFYDVKGKDTLLAESYAEAFLKKAKSEGDTLKMAKAYRLFRHNTNDKRKILKCIDSLIEITKNIRNKEYPALGYLLKGHFFYNSGKYKTALEYYLKALKFAKNQNNIAQLILIKQTIGAIKNRWGAYDEALEIYKDHLRYIRNQKNYKVRFKEKYLNALHNLSLSYINNKKLDSASIYINEGIKESLKIKDSSKYYMFILIEGTRLYDIGQYNIALDSINKAIPYIHNTDLAISHLYKGKIYNQLNKVEKSIYHFKKVDSFFVNTNHAYPELTDAYQVMAEYYKEKDDLRNQLLYLEKFLYADSIIKSNFIYLNETISNKYDIPLLLAEKQTIISKLENENFSNLKIIYILITITFTFLVFIGLYYNKQRKYKKRLKMLLDQNNEDVRDETLYSNEKNELEIDVFIINTLLTKLEKFENNQEYLQSNLSLASLSKQFGTNSAYLSKVINVYKNKNFANYLNDLRIDYTIKKIKTDSKLQSFTIKAIAEEMGFSTSQSFATAFYKRTGIYPSYFIRGLKKLKQQQN